MKFSGDENWGGQCALGRRQSPIDLAEGASVVGRYASLSFINYTVPIQNAKVKHTGHSREYSKKNSINPILMNVMTMIGHVIIYTYLLKSN